MPSPGFFELYPKAQPALPAGAYLLAADQELQASPPNGADGSLAVDGSDFTLKIVSPRYTMPPDQILSTFPPAAAVGDWRERLPQIVFKRRTMPWERNPGSGTFGPDTPPWLALIVLAEGEGTLSGEVPVSQCVTAPLQLAGDADTAQGRYLEVTETIVRKIFPTIDDLHLLAHVRKVDLSDTELALGDDDGYLAVVLANRLPQPGPPAEPGGEPTSVRYSAHLVNLEGQLEALPTTQQSESVFDFAVHMPELVDAGLMTVAEDLGPVVSIDDLVMHEIEASGLQLELDEGADEVAGPRAAGAATLGLTGGVHVVPPAGTGIESAAGGFAVGPARAVGTRTDEVRSAAQWLVGTPLSELAEFAGNFTRPIVKRFRFPVLVSWDFVCTGDGGFERLMNRLESGMLGTVDPAADPALQPDISATGHVSLSHRTRRGEPAESWFRGPLVPQPTVRTVPDGDGTLPLAHTGDQLRRVVPDGHEDVGLAAAFEIGRLLALSKPGVVGALMAWREELFGAARAATLASEFADLLVSGVAGAVLAGRRSLDGLLATELLIPYAERVPDLVGPRAADFTTARRPAEVEQLEADAALAGLGLDAAVVAERAKQFGLAGLGTIDVAVAPVGEGPVSDSDDELTALRGLADTHLDTLAAETLKLSAFDPRGAAPAARARRRPPPDELDRMLEEAAAEAGAVTEGEDDGG